MDIGKWMTSREKELVRKFGQFYHELATGKRAPETAAQRHFIAVARGLERPRTEHEHAYLKAKRATESDRSREEGARIHVPVRPAARRSEIEGPGRDRRKKSTRKRIRIAGETSMVRKRLPDYCLTRWLNDVGARVHAREVQVRNWRVAIEVGGLRFEGVASDFVRALWVAFDALLRHVRSGEIEERFANSVAALVEACADQRRARAFARGLAEKVFCQELSSRASQFRSKESRALPRGIVWDQVLSPLILRFKSVLPRDFMEGKFDEVLKHWISASPLPSSTLGPESDAGSPNAQWIGGEDAYNKAMQQGRVRDYLARKGEDYQ